MRERIAAYFGLEQADTTFGRVRLSPCSSLTRCGRVARFVLTMPSAEAHTRPMKFCHAAALALVGWYLLLPRTSRDFPQGNLDAPLTEWTKRPVTYRTQDECEHDLDKQRRLTNARNRQVSLNYLANAQCVSSDDPRLK